MKIGKTKIDVVPGDITTVDVEAIVNPANNMLWMGGGISSAIRKTGGEVVETEALVNAPADIGTAVATGGGNLHVRRVIHAVISGQDLVTNENFIRKALRASYRKADETGCRSIAVPLLSTGVADIEIHIEAKVIIDETLDYLLQENSSLERIVFVETDDNVRDILKTRLLEKFTKHG